MSAFSKKSDYYQFNSTQHKMTKIVKEDKWTQSSPTTCIIYMAAEKIWLKIKKFKRLHIKTAAAEHHKNDSNL